MSGWREDPFEAGKRYKVIRDFKSLRDSFHESEELTYSKQTYSRYDGQTGYLFIDDTDTVKVIDVHDDDPIETVIEKLSPIE